MTNQIKRPSGFPISATPKRGGVERTAKAGSTAQVEQELSGDLLRPPARRGFTVIPSQGVLEGLIERAVAALKKGMIWDRGSIVNLLV